MRIIHQTILDAIKEKDCFTLLSRLSRYAQLPKDLALIDGNTGKTLQQLIDESEINFSIQHSMEYDFEEIITLNITPIQSIFTNLQKGAIPNIRELRQILLLGANVNQEIDINGNTILHQRILRGIHPLALRELIKAGGDIYKKNNQGKTPLELADEVTSKYLLSLNDQYNAKNKVIIRIQRQRRLKKKLESASIKLIHNSLPLFANPPLKSNPPDAEKINLWIKNHQKVDRKIAKEVASSIQHISFKHFLFGLKMAIKKFNLYLHSLPEAQRNFVLLVDYRQNKSGPWVTKLAQQFFAFTPSIIINTKEKDLEQFMPSIDLSHIVLLDDASYTGNSLYTIQENFYTLFLNKNSKLMNLRLHLIVPFITERARERFRDFPTLLYTQETIPKFKIKGTFFQGETATYFDHKIPEDLSTIECIANGKLITGEPSDILFVESRTPPYKL